MGPGSSHESTDAARHKLNQFLRLHGDEAAAHFEELCASHPELESELRTLFAELGSDADAAATFAPAPQQDDDASTAPQAPLDQAGTTLSPVPAAGDEVSTTSPEPSGENAPQAPPARIPRVPVGERIKGRYEIRGVLGEGGQGIVYHAWDHEMRRDVAIKRTLQSDEATVERFRHEVHATARLDHQNIRKAFNLETDDQGLVLVLEFVEGESLSQLVKRSGPLSDDDLTNMARGLARALVHVHRRDVLHRDIKPGNILITPDGTPKLCDFGIARQGTDSDLTLKGVGFGTATYASPEQCRGDELDERTDIYAFGKTLYLAATGEPPRVVREQRIPETWRSLLLQCLEEQRDRRPKSAELLLESIEEFASVPRQISPGTTAAYDPTAAVRCVGCGAGNAADTRYCRGCGDALFAECPNPDCLKEERVDVVHCGHCGENIVKGKQAWVELHQAEADFAVGHFDSALSGARSALSVYPRLPEARDLVSRADEARRRLELLRTRAREAEQDRGARKALALWKQLLDLAPEDREARQSAVRLVKQRRREVFDSTLQAVQIAFDQGDLAKLQELHEKLQGLRVPETQGDLDRVRSLVEQLEKQQRRQLHVDLGEILDDSRRVALADRLIDELGAAGESRQVLEQLQSRMTWTRQRGWLDNQLEEGDLQVAGECLEPLVQAGQDAERPTEEIGSELTRAGLALIAGGEIGWAEVAHELLEEIEAPEQADQLSAALSAFSRSRFRRKLLMRAVLSLVLLLMIAGTAAFFIIESVRSDIRSALTALEAGDTAAVAERLADVGLEPPELQTAIDVTWKVLGAPADTATLVSRIDALRSPVDDLSPDDAGSLGSAGLERARAQLEDLATTLSAMGIATGLGRTNDLFRDTAARRLPLFEGRVDEPLTDAEWPLALAILEHDFSPLDPSLDEARTLHLARRVLSTGAHRLDTALGRPPGDDALSAALRLDDLLSLPDARRLLDPADSIVKGLKDVLDKPWGDAIELSQDYALLAWQLPESTNSWPSRLSWADATAVFSWVEDRPADDSADRGFYLSDAPVDNVPADAELRIPSVAQRRRAAGDDNIRYEQLQHHMVIDWGVPPPPGQPLFRLDEWTGVINADTKGAVQLVCALENGPEGAEPVLILQPHDSESTDPRRERLSQGADGHWISSDLTQQADGLYDVILKLEGNDGTTGAVAIRTDKGTSTASLILLVDRAAPWIELVTKLPPKTGLRSIPLVVQVSDGGPGPIETLALVDAEGLVLAELRPPDGEVTIVWHFDDGASVHRARLQAVDAAGNDARAVELEIAADQDVLQLDSITLSGRFFWEVEGHKAWVAGAEDLDVRIVTNKALGADSIVRGPGRIGDLPADKLPGNTKVLTARLDIDYLSRDVWKTFEVELQDASTENLLGRELQLRIDDSGPHFVGRKPQYWSRDNYWRYKGQITDDDSSGVASVWLEPHKGLRLDGTALEGQGTAPAWEIAPSKQNQAKIWHEATLFAEDRVGNRSSEDVKVHFWTKALFIEKAFLEAAADGTKYKLTNTASGSDWSSLLAVREDQAFSSLELWFPNQIGRATALGKSRFNWEYEIEKNFVRFTIPLEEVGLEHHNFDDGQLKIDVFINNKANEQTKSSVKIDFALLQAGLQDSRSRRIHAVALQNGRASAVPAGTGNDDWGPLLKSTAQSLRALSDETLVLPESSWFSDERPRVQDVQISSDARQIAICGESDEFILRRVGEQNEKLEHEDAENLTHLGFSHSGDRLVSVDDAGMWVLHDTSTQKVVIQRSADGPVGAISCADEGQLVSALVTRGGTTGVIDSGAPAVIDRSRESRPRRPGARRPGERGRRPVKQRAGQRGRPVLE